MYRRIIPQHVTESNSGYAYVRALSTFCVGGAILEREFNELSKGTARKSYFLWERTELVTPSLGVMENLPIMRMTCKYTIS